jgi:hypothetical protein
MQDQRDQRELTIFPSAISMDEPMTSIIIISGDEPIIISGEEPIIMSGEEPIIMSGGEPESMVSFA